MAYTVLHLEDDPHLVELVNIGFEQLGFPGEILTVPTVNQALALLQRRREAGHPVDLILVDMEVPDGSGLDVIRRVKANPAWAAIPVVVLSNVVDPQEVTEAYALGANCYLSKLSRGKSIFDAVGALYGCWFDHALLPTAPPSTRGGELLGRAVGLKARASQFYFRLAQALSDESEGGQPWLDLALNESNHANLLGFFRDHARQVDIEAEAGERYSAYGARREAALDAAEKAAVREPKTAAESAFRWAVDLESSVDPSVLADALALLFPRSPVAARAFRDGMAGHLRHLAELTLRRVRDSEVRQRAEALLRTAQQIKSSPLAGR